jgi:hypothetical protein
MIQHQCDVCGSDKCSLHTAAEEAKLELKTSGTYFVEFSAKEIEFLIRALVSNYAEDESDFVSKYNISSQGISGELIGKLIKIIPSGIDIYHKARKSLSLNSSLNKKLFMGNGYHSIINANKLHRRLRFATNQLGGLEQNGGMGTEFDTDLDRECIIDIVNVVKDIMIAFGLTEKDFK